MQLRPLGKSGLRVSAIGLGAMPLSTGASRPSEREGVRVVHAALDAGVTLIDTADVYCRDHRDIGHNERLIALALRERGAEAHGVVVATKGGLERPDGAWTDNGRPEHVRAAIDASLRALGVERITLWQLHAPDPEVPLEDTLGEVSRAVEAGKIAHVGLSNVSVEELDQASAIVEVVSVQNRCSPFERDAWADGVIAACEARGIAFLPYSPVGGGRGKVRVADDPALNEVARARGVSPFRVALAWLLASSPAMIPIPGASRVASIQDSAAAADLVLSADERARLDRAFPTA